MKVLHLNANYLYTNLHQCMIRTLTGLGIDNQVFVPIHTRNNLVVTPDKNVKTSICYKKWDRLFFDNKQKKIKKALETNLAVNDFNLIHAYTLFTDGNCAYELSKKYGVPYVVAVRDTDVNVFFRHMSCLRNRGVEILNNAAAVFFLSPAYKQQVLAKHVPEALKKHIEDKSYIIPNGIDDFWLDNSYTERDFIKIKKRLLEKQVRIIFVGTICKRKNPLTILKAMDLLEKRGYKVEFTVAGGLADKHIAKVLLSDKRVCYAGKLTKNDLLERYRKNDIFVMPSLTETFGLVYAEAMSQGLPVIYTKGQGFDGQFPEGTVGYHVDGKDPEDVANAIEKIIERYEAISEGCIKNVAKFKWNTICENYKSIYEEICGVQNEE